METLRLMEIHWSYGYNYPELELANETLAIELFV